MQQLKAINQLLRLFRAPQTSRTPAWYLYIRSLIKH